jgi:hypothetical protein
VWSLAADAVLSVLTKLIRPSLADTSGLSRGATAAEPLLYALSCVPTPGGTQRSIPTLANQVGKGIPAHQEQAVKQAVGTLIHELTAVDTPGPGNTALLRTTTTTSTAYCHSSSLF